MESIKLILILSVLCTISQATFPRNISSPSPKRDTLSENPQRSLQENDENKIILYFNQNCDYPSGFKNDYRKDISLIRQGYDTYEIDISKKISLKKDAEVEIHFANPIKTFEHFFDSTYDKNMEFVEFIDFTYFDSSEVENMNHMFAGCKSLKSINFAHFSTNKVTSMISVFLNCNSLTSLDLSNFNTEKVKDVTNMFSNCVSLTYLDISNFNLLNANYDRSMVRNLNNLNFLNLRNYQDRKHLGPFVIEV